MGCRSLNWIAGERGPRSVGVCDPGAGASVSGKRKEREVPLNRAQCTDNAARETPGSRPGCRCLFYIQGAAGSEIS